MEALVAPVPDTSVVVTEISIRSYLNADGESRFSFEITQGTPYDVGLGLLEQVRLSLGQEWLAAQEEEE